MISDIRVGLRLLWRDKAFTLTVALTLALCIGANTALFSVVHDVLLKPLPVPESERIVLMGNAYPQPGLYGKFYDQDQDPLVEVVRDTVGRHDTFALACNAKYYEDMGYFGHVNCSDNFNAQLLPYTIAPRKGWPALNFFFNTAFDRQNLLVSDEPWSRPGDYVLLRALTDLVCLSSACPDDIDPANAWNPTEVQIRVYPATERFSVDESGRP